MYHCLGPLWGLFSLGTAVGFVYSHCGMPFRILLIIVIAALAVAGEPPDANALDRYAIPPTASPERSADLAALAKQIAREHECANDEVSISKLEYYDFGFDGKRDLEPIRITLHSGK